MVIYSRTPFVFGKSWKRTSDLINVHFSNPILSDCFTVGCNEFNKKTRAYLIIYNFLNFFFAFKFDKLKYQQFFDQRDNPTHLELFQSEQPSMNDSDES